MERKALLVKYINRLCVGFALSNLSVCFKQVCLELYIIAVLIVAASRLFVFPHYGRIRFGHSRSGTSCCNGLSVYKRCRLPEAVRRLDGYMPDNLLITAIDVKAAETHLCTALIQAADTGG